MRVRLFETAMLALVLATPACAAEVTISDGWIRALPNNESAGGYFTLQNNGASAIALTGASSPDCGMLMLMTYVKDDMEGMAGMSGMGGGMRAIQSIPVPAHGTLKFAAGGYHLMCMNPAAAIRPGGTTTVTLKFDDGSSASAKFAVKNARGQ